MGTQEEFEKIMGMDKEEELIEYLGDSIKAMLDIMKKDVDGSVPEETLETAGCTGGCEGYDEFGMPDCKNCSQFHEEIGK